MTAKNLCRKKLFDTNAVLERAKALTKCPDAMLHRDKFMKRFKSETSGKTQIAEVVTELEKRIQQQEAAGVLPEAWTKVREDCSNIIL